MFSSSDFKSGFRNFQNDRPGFFLSAVFVGTERLEQCFALQVCRTRSARTCPPHSPHSCPSGSPSVSPWLTALCSAHPSHSPLTLPSHRPLLRTRSAHAPHSLLSTRLAASLSAPSRRHATPRGRPFFASCTLCIATFGKTNDTHTSRGRPPHTRPPPQSYSQRSCTYILSLLSHALHLHSPRQFAIDVGRHPAPSRGG